MYVTLPKDVIREILILEDEKHAEQTRAMDMTMQVVHFLEARHVVRFRKKKPLRFVIV